MALFHRRRNAAPAYPQEETAETRETDGSSLIGPGALDSGASPMGVQPRDDRDLDAKALRASANPEDDGARAALIEAERRDEEGRR